MLELTSEQAQGSEGSGGRGKRGCLALEGGDGERATTSRLQLSPRASGEVLPQRERERPSCVFVLSSWSVVGIVVAAIVFILGFGVVVWHWRRSGGAGGGVGQEGRGSVPVGGGVGPEGQGPRDPGRRELVQRGTIALFVAAMSGVVAAAVDYVWPSVTGATGGRFRLGSRAAIQQRISGQGRPYYDLSGRFYMAEYPAEDLAKAERAYPAPQLDSMELGLLALSQKCPHLGCTVKWCSSSGWFECPCHGSRYNAVGELQRGPSPRGLDRFHVGVVAGEVEVDTSIIFLGPPPGTQTTDQPAKGPHCY